MVVLPSNIGPVILGMPTGLWAALGLIPFFILYLIRPRPKRMELPSLMFFMRGSGKSIVQSFFRTLLRDLLFLLQLIVCIALLMIPSQPYTNTTINLAAENVVLVIDTSASSQVQMEGGTRLAHALDQAKNLLGKQNTIILAKGTPEVIAQDVSAIEALKKLQAIQPTDTGSRIGEAMLQAGQLLEGDGRIVVLSDFDNTDGMDPKTAKTALESQGKHITFINTATGSVDNVGFIDLAVREDVSTAYVRNFGTKEVTVPLQIGDSTRQLTIAAGDVTTVAFKTPPGVTQLKLTTGDAFPADDQAVMSAPTASQIKVLLITNDKSKFLSSALTSSPLIDLAVSEPPIVSKEQYDVYIVDHVTASQVLPGTYTDLLKDAQNGAGVVIVAQDGMGGTDYGQLLPVNIIGEGKDAYVHKDQGGSLTNNLDFGNVKTYIKTSLAPGAVSLASTTDNSSIIAIKTAGSGLVLYYGLLESSSDFKLTPDYPIFWQNAMRQLAQRPAILDLNKKAGDSITVDGKTTVKGPDGKPIAGPLITFERAGTYTVDDRTVAVNYLNAAESTLRYHPDMVTDQSDSAGSLREERPFYWEVPLLVIAAAFLLFEIIFLKVRGDI